MKPQKTPPTLHFEPFVRPSSVAALRNELRAGLPDVDDFELVGDTSGQPATSPRTLTTHQNRTVTTGENGTRKIIYGDVEYDYLEDDEDDETYGDDETPGYQYDNNGAFTIRSGADWLAQNDGAMPPEAMLFGSLWMQHELCILFADTNVGKSILAVQIADSISRGLPIPGMALTAAPAPVLYIDFELSEQQFRSRYSTGEQGKYPFTANFHRATLNPFSNKQKRFATYEEFINNEIENALLGCKAQALIIDNITCLRYGTQNAAGAYNLMQYLQAIKRRYQISILVLAHTPKRNPAKPLSRNDLHGSKMLLNLADSAFAIGESRQQPGLRYLKQIKQRSASETHGAENVCLGSIRRTGSFLHFTFTGHSHENDHLAPQTEQYRRSIEHRIIQLNQQGQSVRKIANQLGLASTTVFRTLKRMERYAQEEEPTPMTNHHATNDQPGCADVVGCADVQICECADENQYAEIQLRTVEKALQKAPAPFDSNIINLSQNAAHPLSAQRREGRPAEQGRGESIPEPLTPYKPITQKEYSPAPPMTNDQSTNDHSNDQSTNNQKPLTPHEPTTHDNPKNAAHPLSAQRREGRPAERGRGESTPELLTPYEPTTQKEHTPQKNCHPEALEGRPEPLTPYEPITPKEYSPATPMTNNQSTNDQKPPALCDSLPGEGREGFSEPLTPHEPTTQKEQTPQKNCHPEAQACPEVTRREGRPEPLTPYNPITQKEYSPAPPMINDQSTNDQLPHSISTIDAKIQALIHLAEHNPSALTPADERLLRMLKPQTLEHTG